MFSDSERWSSCLRVRQHRPAPSLLYIYIYIQFVLFSYFTGKSPELFHKLHDSMKMIDWLCQGINLLPPQLTSLQPVVFICFTVDISSHPNPFFNKLYESVKIIGWLSPGVFSTPPPPPPPPTYPPIPHPAVSPKPCNDTISPSPSPPLCLPPNPPSTRHA